MKKTFKLPSIIVLVLLLVVTSCTNNEVEPLFEQTIKERTDALKKKYHDILTAPENGWVGYYSPNDNFGAYIMLMNFNKDGSVSIKSDYEVGAKDNTTTYRLDKTLKIELVLESHAVFSDIFEINRNNNDGEFVFNILKATQDEVVLESKRDSGYDDDSDVTIFTLRKASPDDLNFNPVEIDEWFNNIAGDGTQSVFRNILLNDKVIAAFDFDPDTRVSAIEYIDDGDTVIETSAIVASATGFYFIKPLDISGTILTSFTFDETTNEYVNTEDNLKIKYDNVPGIPLDPYPFGEINDNARYNFLEPEKTSLAFKTFYDEFSDSLLATYNLRLDRVYMRNLLSTTGMPNIQIYTSAGRFRWFFSYEINDDGKIYFTLTGDTSTNVTPATATVFEPLFKIIIGSELGYYTNKTGGLQSFTNGTFSMINASQPQYSINYYDF